MRFEKRQPPRSFEVGLGTKITIHDCGSIHLQPDEQVTFLTEAGGEYDVARKDWGFYATPSVNGRLSAQGFKTALVRNAQGRYYVMVVDTACLEDFRAYLATDQQELVEWLDERT